MQDYALVIRHREEYWEELSPEVRDDILRRYFAWFDDLRDREILKGAHSLRDGGRLIKIVDGKVVDGPYTETKEIVGGFVLVRAESWDHAAQIARTCPALEEQDRSLWDAGRINAGLALLMEAGRGEQLSEYHLLAGIAACHATSLAYESTDWARIASLYEMLLRERPAFTVRVNHAIAVSMRDGPEEGLRLLGDREAQEAKTRQEVGSEHLLPAARGEMLRRANRMAEAAGEYERAAGLAPNEGERRLFERRARDCAG